MNKEVRIALADNSEKTRLQFKTILQQVNHYKIIFEAINGNDLFQKLKNEKVDIILVNFQMPFLNRVQSIPELKMDFPNLKIILISLYNNPVLLWNYINAGVNGLLLTQPKLTQIKRSIDGVLHKGYYCSEAILKSIASLHPKKAVTDEIIFTERELEIIRLIYEEKSSSEIAKTLYISKRTVDWHRNMIMKRIGTKSSIGIVKYALKNGILEEK